VRSWIFVPVAALLLLAIFSVLRARRIERLSTFSGSSAGLAAAHSWKPTLILPGHPNPGYEWLDETLVMMRTGTARIRQVDYENHPFGHPESSGSPYRWWLGALAGLWHIVVGSGLGASVEAAALGADPILLALGVVAVALLFSRRLGAASACFASAALVALYPFAGEFIPGAPTDLGLALLVALLSVIPLLPAGAALRGSSSRDFALAGMAGGLGLWINASVQAPIVLGIGMGALLSVFTYGPADGEARSGAASLWRLWSLVGAATCLGAYLLEYFPSHLASWELRVNHPAYGIFWLGMGEIIAMAFAPASRRPLSRIAALVLAGTALLSVPAVLYFTHGLGFFSKDPPHMHLVQIPDGPIAVSLWAWLLQNGFTPAVWATFLPLILLVPAVGFLVLGAPQSPFKRAFIVAGGPLLTALGMAFWQIRWFSGVDAMVVVLLAILAASVQRSARPRLAVTALAGVGALLLLPGLLRLVPAAGDSRTENEGLLERDLASMLKGRVGSAPCVVVAPPDSTVGLHYYGGITGLATFDWQNTDGLEAAVRIMSASTPEEAQALIARRGVTHLIIPQWDPMMEAYARMGMGEVARTFFDRLQQWTLPPWLRPVPYLMPTVPGFEGQAVTILEVVDDQDDAVAASRLTEYFLDTSQLELAQSSGQALRRFPADLGALIARARVSIAAGDAEETARTLEALVRRIEPPMDDDLFWDQRLSLAVVLAQKQRLEPARRELQRCLTSATESDVRSASIVALYRLEVLSHALGLRFVDPKLESLSVDLLPTELRKKISASEH
jgi:hypothetical protein